MSITNTPLWSSGRQTHSLSNRSPKAVGEGLDIALHNGSHRIRISSRQSPTHPTPAKYLTESEMRVLALISPKDADGQVDPPRPLGSPHCVTRGQMPTAQDA